jgi:hypothetical protein
MKYAAAALALICVSIPAFAQVSPYDARGPYTIKQAQLRGCHFFWPVKPDAKPSPVILWGNGSNSMVMVYSTMLNHWASHGFIVAASMSGSAGTGQPLLDCLDYLTRENAREGGALHNIADLAHVGASGHSQGGGGAIMAGRDPRVTATAPMQPYTQGARYSEAGAETKQHGPMLLLSGGMDTIADPARQHQPVFEKANVPVVWATLLPAGHNAPAVRDSGPYRPAALAFFLWQLAGDDKAGAMFESAQCGYCASDAWVIEKRGVD